MAPQADHRAQLQRQAVEQMAPPDLRGLDAGVGYAATFPTALARLTIDNIRQGRDGLKGDVLVEVGPFGTDYRTLMEGRLELSSVSQRESWERRLRKRSSATNWEAVLDLFCAAVLRAEKRLDKPAILLRDAQRPAVSGMLLGPLIVAAFPTIWYGDGGTAKSYIALAAALSIHVGVPVIGKMQPAQPLRVLYIDFEFDEWEHRERMRKLLQLLPTDDTERYPEVAYLDCKGGTIVNQVERIMRAARDYRSEFIVVDSISYAAEGPLNEDETARLYYRKIGQIGLPSLSIAHVPKNGNVESPFGSVHWKNLSRLAWHFQNCETDHQRELLLKLTCKKHSTTEEPKPVGISMKFRPDSVDVEVAAAERLVGTADDGWKQIRAVLASENRPMTYEEVALALGQEPAQVRARVSERKEVFVVLKPVEGSRRNRVALRAREP